jgi:molybdenum cofactor biosynthesis enzyme MoaA
VASLCKLLTITIFLFTAGLSSLRSHGLKQIGITTNGITLSRHLSNLVSSGLTHLNISLDTLDPHKFELMTRRPASGLEKVLRGIDAALAMGVAHVKINVVVIRGLNDTQDVLDFVEWAKDRRIIVRFIEYMPFDGNRWKPQKLVPFQQLLSTIRERYGPLQKVEDDANDTSKHWKVPGHVGSIGFITRLVVGVAGYLQRSSC